MSGFQTEHNLDFEARPWTPPIVTKSSHEFIEYRIGTCEGLYCSDETSYSILTVKNSQKGNGHLNDVFQWFENSCKRDGKDLKVLEIQTERFYNHLVLKRGFTPIDKENVIKKYQMMM